MANVQVLDLNGDEQLDILVGNDSQANHAYSVKTKAGSSVRPPLAWRATATAWAKPPWAWRSRTTTETANRISSAPTTPPTPTPSWRVSGWLFADRTAVRGLGVNSRPARLVHEIGDVDLDSDEDLLFVNGHVYPQATPSTMGSAWAQPMVLMDQSQTVCAGRDLPQPPEQGRLAVLFDADGDQDLDVVTVTRDGAVNLTAAIPAPRRTRMHDSLPRQLAGPTRPNHLGRTPRPSSAGSLPAAASVVQPRGARPRARGSVVVQVDGLPGETCEIASDPRSRSVIWDTSSTTNSTP